MRNTIVVLLIIIVIGVVAYEYRNSPWLAPLFGATTTQNTQQQINKVSYSCDANKTIVATYYASTGSAQTNSAAANPTVPPAPNGSVALMLSDGRSMTLPQTISGSGIRYANADESVVFWSKGNTAFVTEGKDQQQTFANCIVASNISGQENWHTYASSAQGFSIRYPDGYTLDTNYAYQEMGPGKDIQGIKLTVPATMATGTNLSSDSYVSVEELPKAQTCSADLFLDTQVGSTTTVTDNGVTYSMAKGQGAGAGNLYNEVVYAIPGTSPCLAVRYYIHSTQLGNYPAGTRTAFDQAALMQDFDGIRASLVIGK